MPKPNRGKTEAIKDRAVYVYLSSLEMVEEWKHRAEKTGDSISRFVVERVEDSLSGGLSRKAPFSHPLMGHSLPNPFTSPNG
jgi:hypothetical protein